MTLQQRSSHELSFFRQTRFFWWIIRDLARKYTRLLFIGFLSGLGFSLVFWQIQPILFSSVFLPVDRIGVVGSYTPLTLPYSITNLISTGLTTISVDGSALPGLSDYWEATDSGKRYIFHIDTDSTWHNGQKVTAYDINYNIKNVTFSPLSESEVEATLDSPYSPFPVMVSKPLFKKGLIGIGDMKVASLKLNGDTIESLRIIPVNMNSGRPRAKEYVFYRTQNQAILAYKQGEVDILESLDNPHELIHWGNTTIKNTTQYNRIVALFFNWKDQVVGDKTFRQALGYAMPHIQEEEAFSPISSVSWAYTDKVRKYSPDDVQAKKMLSAAKIGTESAHLTITTFSSFLETAQLIANTWSSYDIKTDVQIVNVIPSTYQVFLSAIDLPPDPDQYHLWHSTQLDTNITGYGNVKIDKLLEDGRQELEPEKRKVLYYDFQRRITEDAPALFLYYPRTYTVRRGT